jgi:hypothetical protein
MKSTCKISLKIIGNLLIQASIVLLIFDLVEQVLILQAVQYERRNFKQKDRNSLIGKERKTKQCQETNKRKIFERTTTPSKFLIFFKKIEIIYYYFMKIISGPIRCCSPADISLSNHTITSTVVRLL